MTWISGVKRKNIMRDTINDIQLSDELLKKRGVDLTGEDIYNIVIAAINSTNTPMNEPQKPVRLLRGYKELAAFLHCSVKPWVLWFYALFQLAKHGSG